MVTTRPGLQVLGIVPAGFVAVRSVEDTVAVQS
jgi:hypothetical protein